MNDSKSDRLRHALGQLATRVTIATTAGPDNQSVGITANSFSTVSLDPPMVLWSLASTALSRRAFEKAAYFCVDVLAASQEELSKRFARRGTDKFGGLDWRLGPGSVPTLADAFRILRPGGCLFCFEPNDRAW